jgi:hypothetical protein
MQGQKVDSETQRAKKKDQRPCVMARTRVLRSYPFTQNLFPEILILTWGYMIFFVLFLHRELSCFQIFLAPNYELHLCVQCLQQILIPLWVSERTVVNPLLLLSLSFSLRISVFLALICRFNLQRGKVSSLVVAYIQIPVEYGQTYAACVLSPLLIQMWVIKCRDIAYSFPHGERFTTD